MTQRRESQIFREVTSVIPKGRVRRRARELGVVRRHRKVDVVALVNSLVLGFDGGKERTIAGLRRAYERSTGTTLAPSAFYDRLTPELARLLRELADDAFADLDRVGTRMQHALEAFERVFIADGSLVRFDDSLEADYPSVWTNHMKASAKLHVVMDAAGRIPKRVDVVPGSRHDLNVISIGPWLKGGLLLVDLAYYQGDLFKAIEQEHGFVLCRLKKHARFRIVSSENGSLDGVTIQHAARMMRGKSFDVQVDYLYRRIRRRDFSYLELIRFPGHLTEPVGSRSPGHGKETKQVHRGVQARRGSADAQPRRAHRSPGRRRSGRADQPAAPLGCQA